MAANFHFVPRSVNYKPSKTKKISKGKLRNVQSASTDIRGSTSSILEGNCNKSFAESVGETSVDGTLNVISSPESDGESDEDSSDIVYFSKNQRWPEEGEPVCVVCGRYGEFICDQTEADVCSKECKAKNLQLRKTGKKQIQEESKTLGSADGRSTGPSYSKTITENNRKPTLSECKSFAPQENVTFEYTVHPQIASLSEKQIHELRSRMEISVRGLNVERPILEFSHCGFCEQLSRNLKTCGYVTPTPVQMQVISVALTRRDLLACAQTGSGKTAAFLLPMITRLHYKIGK
jgi:ATP-dependent RNA helicase DDX59